MAGRTKGMMSLLIQSCVIQALFKPKLPFVPVLIHSRFSFVLLCFCPHERATGPVSREALLRA